MRDFGEIRYNLHTMLLNNCCFLNNICCESRSYLSLKRFYIHKFHIYCAMWVEIGMSDLHRMLLNLGEFPKNRLRQSRNFLMGVNKTIFTCVQ